MKTMPYRNDSHERERVTLNIRTDVLAQLGDVSDEYDTSLSNVVEMALVKSLYEDDDNDYLRVRLQALQAERERVNDEIDALEDRLDE